MNYTILKYSGIHICFNGRVTSSQLYNYLVDWADAREYSEIHSKLLGKSGKA